LDTNILDFILYENLLEKNSYLTYQDIQDQIIEYHLNFIDVIDEDIEWKTSIPMFVTTFYKSIEEFKKIPTQQGYWDYYKTLNEIWFAENNLSEEKLIALKARAFRAYPSLVRDIHFSKYLQSNLEGVKVIYNEILDIEHGIDLLLINNKNIFALNLFVNLNRSLFARQKKHYRHTKFGNVIYKDVEINLRGSDVCGQFYLYGRNELLRIIIDLGL
jgi:hypothetical protein